MTKWNEVYNHIMRRFVQGISAVSEAPAGPIEFTAWYVENHPKSVFNGGGFTELTKEQIEEIRDEIIKIHWPIKEDGASSIPEPVEEDRPTIQKELEDQDQEEIEEDE